MGDKVYFQALTEIVLAVVEHRTGDFHDSCKMLGDYLQENGDEAEGLWWAARDWSKVEARWSGHRPGENPLESFHYGLAVWPDGQFSFDLAVSLLDAGKAWLEQWRLERK